MRKIILFALFVNCLLTYSQIKVTDHTPIKVKKEIAAYDSLHNYIEEKNAIQYIGQTLYLPKSSSTEEYGFWNFAKDLKGNVYCPMKEYSRTTEYKKVAGKYFKVLDVKLNKDYYTPIIYLQLKEKDSGEELYYKLENEYQYHFIIEGFFKKMTQLFLNKYFYIDKSEARFIEFNTNNKNIVFGKNTLYGRVLRLKCIDHSLDESNNSTKDLFTLISDEGQLIYFTQKDMIPESSYFLDEKKIAKIKHQWDEDTWRYNKLAKEMQETDSIKKVVLHQVSKKYCNKKVYNLYNNMLDKLCCYTIDSIWYNSKYLANNVRIQLKNPQNELFEIDSDIDINSIELLSISADFITIPPKQKYPHVRYWEMIKKGIVKIGMTKQEARLSWGEPSDINKTSGSWGTHEQWVYSGSYLYFENGKLTSIQN